MNAQFYGERETFRKSLTLRVCIVDVLFPARLLGRAVFPFNFSVNDSDWISMSSQQPILASDIIWRRTCMFEMLPGCIIR